MNSKENSTKDNNEMDEIEKNVCHECIGNKSLKEFIKAEGKKQPCSYCGRYRKAVGFDSFYDAIMDGVCYAYSRAVDELPVDEGEYVGKTYTSQDLINDELSDEIAANDDRILDDIVEIMPDETWCDKDPFDNRADDDFYSWDAFSKMVREKMRFVFYRISEDNKRSLQPSDILDLISHYTREVRLTRTIRSSTKLYRCRTLNDDQWYTNPDDYGPPDSANAVAGRMNAAGIEMLYLAMDEETTLREAYSPNREYAVVVQYRVEEPLYVLDLARLEKMKMPSVFDKENRDTSHAIRFLKMFAKDISKQRMNKNTDTEYVPTQIVTEFLRYVNRKDGDRYDGICYSSSLNPGGTCLVLFMNREDVRRGKNGIHLIPSETRFYKKQFCELKDARTAEARNELVANATIARTGNTPMKDIAASSFGSSKKGLV